MGKKKEIVAYKTWKCKYCSETRQESNDMWRHLKEKHNIGSVESGNGVRVKLSEPLDNALPTEAVSKGYGLSWWSPAVFKEDSVFLKKHDQEVYRWYYIPSMAEVWDKIKELESV